MIDTTKLAVVSALTSLAIAGSIVQGPSGGWTGIARADAPPVSVTVDRIANSKSDEGRRNAIYLTFRNESIAVANEVRFAIRQGQDVVQVADSGTFSPHVNISHRFPNDNPSFGSHWLTPEAVVTYVRFADGTTWTGDHGAKAQAQARR